MKFVFSLVFALSLPFASLAGPGSLEGHDGPCKQDRETLCKDMKGKDMMKCMHDNKDKVSPACKEHIEKMKEHMKDAREACHADVEKLCADVKPGKGAIMKCLHSKKDQLSSDCRAEMEKAHGRQRK